MTYVILVVEDNERNLKLLRDVLEYAGYDVVTVKGLPAPHAAVGVLACGTVWAGVTFAEAC